MADEIPAESRNDEITYTDGGKQKYSRGGGGFTIANLFTINPTRTALESNMGLRG